MDDHNSDLSEDVDDGDFDLTEGSDDGFGFAWSDTEEQSASSSPVVVDKFEYSKLKLEKNTSFRLLALQPRPGTSLDVKCKLRDVDLHAEDCPDYEALSYTWGNQPEYFGITVNSQSLKITGNLIDALRNLRPQEQEEERLLWVDAICINQSDEEEKTHQVRQMGDIYRRAKRVVVWLGDSDQLKDVVFEFLTWGPQDNNHIEYLRDSWENNPVLQPLKKDVQASMTHLLRHPWFTRVWVIQEVAQSRSAVVMRGHYSVEAATFAQLPDLIGVPVDRHCRQVFNVMPGMRYAPVSQAADFNQNGTWIHRSLRTLLGDFRESQSTEPKDKIFALLGLSTEHEEASARLSYSKKEKEFVNAIIASLIPAVPQEALPAWTLSAFWANLDCLEDCLIKYAFQMGSKAWPWAKELVKTGALNCDTKLSILSFAAKYNWGKMIALLLETGHIDPNMADETLLDWEAEVGFNNVLNTLLEKAMFYPKSTGQAERLPLKRAIGDAEKNAISLWLEKEENDCEFQDEMGRTPLSWAAGYHYGTWMVEALLKARKCNLELVDEIGFTPLMWGTQAENINTMRLLLDADEALNGGRVRVTTLQAAMSLGGPPGYEDIYRPLIDYDRERRNHYD
ncbi:heterokaryon incompatibility protein-domain-containing protein [Boeremia exigua]|uniref:heterokaryon incompatibility protein-domain-containing protein n=1 Tax=Boeremia exigua TaxID=749465 RepID=UPI001E8E6581|nr:heterokaryon incompatibility protein-domain-containing protein [Boeremia exigua]KAH6637800.1 heterokaryon incompatibility protein-domain-containing protein [Boeremia exigua]